MIEMKTTGLPELVKGLEDLADLGDNAEAIKTLATGARKAMKEVEAQAKSNVLKDSGFLGDSIKTYTVRNIRKLQRSKNRIAHAHVSFVDKQGNAQKALAAEYGTDKQVATPWLRPALYSKMNNVIDTMASETWKAIARRTKAIAKKRAK